MNFMKVMSNGGLKVASLPNQACINLAIKRWRKPSICDICQWHPHSRTRPCFNIKTVCWERGDQRDARAIQSFLYTHYWPREPSVTGLWMHIGCPYLQTLSERYSNTGDRFLAFEKLERTGEKRLVGVLVANKIWPWMVKELEEWAHLCTCRPERNRMYFRAHCLKNPNLFEKFKTDYIWDIEILGTAADVTGQGVATQLLRNALIDAEELRHPLTQVIAVNHYACKVCERNGMSVAWSMDYTDFVDDAGLRVFFPRTPHQTVKIYVKHNPLSNPGTKPCLPQWPI